MAKLAAPSHPSYRHCKTQRVQQLVSALIIFPGFALNKGKSRQEGIKLVHIGRVCLAGG